MLVLLGCNVPTITCPLCRRNIESGPEHSAARLALAGLLEEDGALFTRYAVTRQAE